MSDISQDKLEVSYSAIVEMFHILGENKNELYARAKIIDVCRKTLWKLDFPSRKHYKSCRPGNIVCPSCKGPDVSIAKDLDHTEWHCLRCNHEWKE